MPYDYSDQQVTERAGGAGKDPGRKRTSEELAAKARGGDQAALHQLLDLSGGPGDPNPATGWGTQDAKNYAQLLLRDLIPGYQPDYGKAQDGGFSLGKTLGGVLKVAAPIAALAIPGLGPLASAAIAAGGSAAGGVLSGDKFNLGKTALAGVAGYGGNKLLGGQGIKGIGGIPERLGIGGGPDVGGAPMPGGVNPALGNATQSGQGVLASATQTGGKGIFGSGISGGDLMKYLPLASGALGAVGSYQNGAKADDLRQKAMGYAEGDYLSRSPFREKALAQVNQPMPTAPDLSAVFADPGNPYNRIQRRAA